MFSRPVALSDSPSAGMQDSFSSEPSEVHVRVLCLSGLVNRKGFFFFFFDGKIVLRWV